MKYIVEFIQLYLKGYGSPPLQENDKKSFKKYSYQEQQYSGIDKLSVNSAAEAGRLQMTLTDDVETQLFVHNILVIPGSSRATHSLVFTSTAESEKMSRDAMIEAYTVAEIVKRYIYPLIFDEIQIQIE